SRFGWDHPATASVLASAEKSFAEALAQNPDLVRVDVLPEGFAWNERIVWTPAAPLEHAARTLFSAGIRSISVQPGVRASELRAWVAAMANDAEKRLGPDDDVTTVLWDAALEHIKITLHDEAVAPVVARPRLKLGRAPLDRKKRLALAELARREIAGGSLTKLVDVLTSDLAQVDHEARATLRERLRAAAIELIDRGDLARVVDVYESLWKRIDTPDHPRAEAGKLIESALFDRDVFARALEHLAEAPRDIAKFGVILDRIDGARVTEALVALVGGVDGDLRDALERLVERAAKGREAEIARSIADAPRDVAVRLLGVLARVKTSAAAAEISRLSSHDDEDVRLDAKLFANGEGEAAADEIVKLLDAPTASSRSAALRAVARHKMWAAAPSLLRRLRAAAFVELTIEEQRALLGALLHLSPSQGETVALEMLRTGGMFQSDARETTRVLAIELLGEHATSEAANVALRELARTHWGASQTMREAAERAAHAMDERLATAVVPSQIVEIEVIERRHDSARPAARFDPVPRKALGAELAVRLLDATRSALEGTPSLPALKRVAQALTDLPDIDDARVIAMLVSEPLRGDDARAVALVAALTAGALRQLALPADAIAEAVLAGLEAEVARARSKTNDASAVLAVPSFGRLDEPAARRLVLVAESFATSEDGPPLTTLRGRILALCRRFVRALAGRSGHGVEDVKAVLASMGETGDPGDRDLVDVLARGIDPPAAATARGTLKGTPFVHLLAYMLDHRASGSIDLLSPTGQRRIVVFREGVPFAMDPIPDTTAPDEALAALARLAPQTSYAFYEEVDLLEATESAFLRHGPLALALRAARAWPDRSRIERMLARISHRRLVLHPHAHVEGLDQGSTDREVLAALRRGARLPELRLAHVDALVDVDTLIYVLAVMRQLSLPGLKGDPIG
ncbi:MAG: hypothetical protein ABI551_01120, partial [Polyangiaceae bacterium]